MDELAKVNVNGKEYRLKDEEARDESGGYSTYYADAEIPYPMEEGTSYFVAMSKLSNEGNGIKVGDLLISSNSILCEVTAVSQESSRVKLFPITNIGGNGSGGNADFKTNETLIMKDGVLSVNTTNNMEQDNTLPITSAGVYATVGNIEALLKTI